MANHDLLYSWWWSNAETSNQGEMSIDDLSKKLTPARDSLIIRGEDGKRIGDSGWNYAILKFLLKYCDLPDQLISTLTAAKNYGEWKKHLNVNVSIWKTCNTLSRQGTFKWRYTGDQIKVKHDTDQFSLKKNVVECIVYYVNEQNHGIPLEVAGTGSVPEKSLGDYLQQKEIKGFQRPYCSYLAAILVDEGMIDFENLGQGPGKGIWLYPSSNEGVTNSGIFDEKTLLAEHLPHGEIEQPGDYFQQISKELVDLGKRIAETRVFSSSVWNIDFTNIQRGTIEEVLVDINTWETGTENSLFIYNLNPCPLFLK